MNEGRKPGREVAVVDDDAGVLDAWREAFEIEGMTVATHASVRSVLARLHKDSETVIVSDVRMPGEDGFDLVSAVKAIDPEIPIVLMTGHGDIPMAVRAMRDGIWDFLEKPANPVHLIETVRRAQEYRRLVMENRRLRTNAAVDGWETRLIGRTPVMTALRARLQRVADANADVLIFGETGTGKEVAARALHDLGGRPGRFVAINCGAIPESMLESELFGHEAGAFTSAQERRIGQIEYADGGTLFLDEIESMPLTAQVRLLRVLQERLIVRLGSNVERPVDIRVVAATKADLHALAADGAFRADLAYRLDIVRVELPPLRQRRGDIGLLFQHFVTLAALREGRAARSIDPAVLADLEGRPWPGNVRELRNAAERFALGLDDAEPSAGTSTEDSLEAQVERFEAAVIARALAEQDGRIGLTAAALGISRKTLYLKMRRHGIAVSDAAS